MLSRPDTFEADVIEARPKLKAFALSLCRNPDRADDLVQDTMLRAFQHRATFTPGTNVEAWLFTILRNLFLSEKRKRRYEVEDPDEVLALRMSFEDSPLRKLEAAELLRLVDKMPEGFRRVLRLLADGASYDEIAFELREHIGTIKSRAHRGREMLKAAS